MTTQARQFQIFMVRPVLKFMSDEKRDFTGLSAERLIVGTMFTESLGDYIDQITGPGDETLGPAVGFFQMEKPTHDDIWETFLNARPTLAGRVASIRSNFNPPFEQMAGNIYYAVAMCRLKYWRESMPLPDQFDGSLEDYANYWKKAYNTEKGAGNVSDFYNKARCIMELK